MAFISAKCPECGGSIQLDDARESGFCLYCGTKVLLSESIPQIVKVEGIQTLENKLSNAETYAKLGEVEKAISLLSQITEDFTSDYRAWWMLAKLINAYGYFYKNANVGSVDKIISSKEYMYAISLASESSKAFIDAEYSKYRSSIDQNSKESQRKIEATYKGDYSYINHSYLIDAKNQDECGYEIINGELCEWTYRSNGTFLINSVLKNLAEKRINITGIDQDSLTINGNLKYKMSSEMHPTVKSYFENQQRRLQAEQNEDKEKKEKERKELTKLSLILVGLVVFMVILVIVLT
jgi:hypothetical protein